jgi:hypothetical protein
MTKGLVMVTARGPFVSASTVIEGPRGPSVIVRAAKRGPARSSVARPLVMLATARPSLDTLREIAANKICTLLSRSEIKDLLDLQALIEGGADLDRAFADAEKKEAGADPATLAWILSELSVGPSAILPGGADATRLVAFRDTLVPRLRAMAFERTRTRA